MEPVTHWLDTSWANAVSGARMNMGMGRSPLQRVMAVARARAGAGIVARFAGGELARLTHLDESVVHGAVEAGIEARELGADSHPQCLIIMGNFPDYREPAEPGPIPPNMEVHKRVYRGNVRWQLRPIKGTP